MTLARLTDVLAPAPRLRQGLGAFNVFSIEHAEAFTPPLRLPGRQWYCKSRRTPCATTARWRRSDWPRSPWPATEPFPWSFTSTTPPISELVEEAVALGFGSVMFDASTMPYAENVTATAAVVRRCHERGLDVEAELGEIGGKDGVHAARRSNPA